MNRVSPGRFINESADENEQEDLSQLAALGKADTSLPRETDEAMMLSQYYGVAVAVFVLSRAARNPCASLSASSLAQKCR